MPELYRRAGNTLRPSNEGRSDEIGGSRLAGGTDDGTAAMRYT